jgi:hypothetical protein
MLRHLVLSLALSLMLIVGCHHNSSTNTPPPLPAGAVNQIDADAFRALADTQAFLNSVKQDQESGAVTLTPTEKTVFNQVIQDYDIAAPLAKAYHDSQGAGSPQALQDAINKMKADTTTATAQINTPSLKRKSGGPK